MTMTKGRLEAFTDGVIAIIITIMVLEIKAPQGADFAALQAGLPIFLAYALSYINVGIFWNNHHHMLHATERINGRCGAISFCCSGSPSFPSSSAGLMRQASRHYPSPPMARFSRWQRSDTRSCSER
jgi:uncharacterized membrane protein